MTDGGVAAGVTMAASTLDTTGTTQVSNCNSKEREARLLKLLTMPKHWSHQEFK